MFLFNKFTHRVLRLDNSDLRYPEQQRGGQADVPTSVQCVPQPRLPQAQCGDGAVVSRGHRPLHHQWSRPPAQDLGHQSFEGLYADCVFCVCFNVYLFFVCVPPYQSGTLPLVH